MGKYIDCHNCQNHYDCERTYLGGCTDGKEFEEEKKPTDEEIVKAFEHGSQNHGFFTAINGKWVKYEDVFDLIHRLQDENKQLKSNKFASWKLKFFRLKEEFDKELAEHEEFTKKAKAEIKRLTERETFLENAWKTSLESTQTVEIALKANRAREEELQKQVDELKGLKTVKTVDRNGLCITFFHKNEEVGEASVCDYQGRENNFLHGVEVKEQYRGQGYGRMIVEYMTTHYPVDTLFVERANSTAIRLYERFGFALTCDTFDKDGKTMAVMARGQELYKQAGQSTAKEILDEVSKHFGGKWLVELYKKYGLEWSVEVE